MRRVPVLALALLAGCAARPLLCRVPQPDAYLGRLGGEFQPVDRRVAPRPRGWDDARVTREVAALTTLVDVTLGPETIALTGPALHAQRAARYLRERHAAADRCVRVRVRRARWSHDEGPAFESLNRCDGALWAVIPTPYEEPLLAEPLDDRTLLLDDATPHVAIERSAREVLAEAGTVPEHTFPFRAQRYTTRASVVSGELQLEVTARVALDGHVLVLDWRQTGVRSDEGTDARLRVLDERLGVDQVVSIPRRHEEAAQGRFTVAHDEALVLVQAPADGGLLFTTVTWWTEPGVRLHHDTRLGLRRRAR